MPAAIIPARGGSKRIPRKNIRPFAGKPIIAYAIETAIKSELFDRIIVSTDDEEIARVSKQFGAETPFLRSPELSNDLATTFDVIRDAIVRLELMDDVCCIYPTTPFLQASDLKRAYMQLRSRDIEQFAFSVVQYEMPIERALRLSETGNVHPLDKEHEKTRTQDLPVAWRDAGQFYWGRRQGFLDRLPLFSQYAIGIPIPRERACDIDTEDDWAFAERLFSAHNLL